MVVIIAGVLEWDKLTSTTIPLCYKTYHKAFQEHAEAVTASNVPCTIGQGWETGLISTF